MSWKEAFLELVRIIEASDTDNFQLPYLLYVAKELQASAEQEDIMNLCKQLLILGDDDV